MKPVSVELKRYIDVNYREPYNDIAKSFRFHSMQSTILQNMHAMIRDGHLEWHDNLSTINTIGAIPKGSLFKDIPESFIQIIESSLKQHQVYRMNIGSRVITIAFYAENDKSYSLKKWTEYVKKMYIWLTIISKLASSQCVQNLTVYIYLTQEKKRLPNDPNAVLGRENANTAFTTSCTSDTEIHLYREEEWFKVFIHETIHSYGLDFSTMNNSSANAQIRKIFGISYDVRLYESYTEYWAEIVHMCFLAHFHMVKTPKMENIDNYVKYIEEMMAYEITYSLLQCAKVLSHNELTYDDIVQRVIRGGDYEKTYVSAILPLDVMSSPQNRKVSAKYKEDTPLFSYYIIKSILLFFSNEFLEWTMINNRGSFNFHKTPDNIDSYIQFIKKYAKHPKYVKTMKKIEECLNISKQKSVFQNEPGLNTLRMTVHEDY
jgi:hypothetical protein